MTIAPTAVAPTASAPANSRRWLALAVVMTAAFMDLVDVTIVNIAVPSIQRDTGASFSAVQWITGGYALAFALGLITGGRLGDIFGRKRLFLLGIAGFTVASALCGLSAGPDMLVASRVLQGVAGAMMVPQVLSIIHVTFPAEERGKVFGMYGAMVGLGAVAGPLLGALLTQWNIFGLEWRPIFLVNLPIGIVGLVLGSRFITESKSPNALRVDVVGTVLATLGLLLVLFPLTQGEQLGWPLWTFLSMIAGVVVFGLFVAFERNKTRKHGSPLVELSLFRIKSFAAGIGVQLVFGAATGIFFLIWTLYMQTGLGWETLQAGLTAVPFSLAVGAAAGMSVALLVPKFGRKVLQAGALVMTAGVLLYMLLAAEHGPGITTWEMIPALLVMGFGMGLIISPITDAILSEVPAEHSGSASGLISTVQQLGWAFGLGLVSVAFFGTVGKVSPDDPQRASIYSAAFGQGLWWVAGGLMLAFVLMFALPKKVKPAAQPAL
ncbi:MFS transporter [Amycolatopsis sp. H20-H5]|uniref:MFS transporter n=1 Tax=Amycolatopsis sp. H20-H5 TaxID=3046309 RepID=UPI002DBA1AEC|nr:MFS transporter [Amycolatopsis sp. H20-H5]MEC3974271.1 MFS transporter [Amycolatopsis sp. H20-H5]